MSYLLKSDRPPDRIAVFDTECVISESFARGETRAEPTVPAAEVIAMFEKLRTPEGRDQWTLKTSVMEVVAISTLVRKVDRTGGESQVSLDMVTLGQEPTGAAPIFERDILDRWFNKEISEWSRPVFVGFNSNKFDFPLLIQRAAANRLRLKEFSDRPSNGVDYLAKWDPAREDLMEILALRGSGSANPSLDEAARSAGFPGKIDVSGASVLNLWLEGRYQEIRDYCNTDVFSTYLVMLNTLHLFARTSTENFVAELRYFREWLEVKREQENAAYIDRYLNEWRDLSLPRRLPPWD